MKNLLIILLAAACLALLFRKKFLEMKRASSEKVPEAEKTAEPTSKTLSFSGEILPIPKKPLPKNFAEVNRAFRQGEAEFSRGNIDMAERWFIKTIALYEHHEEALNRLGVIAIQKGESLKAELLYRRLLSLNLKEPIYYCNYARALYNQGKLREAGQAYEMAVTLDPSKANRYVSLGQICYELEQYEKALEKFLEAHLLEPRNLEYLTLVADLYESLERWGELSQFLEKILELNPYDERTQVRLTMSKEKTAEHMPEKTRV